MTSINVSELSADVNITLRQSELRKFASELLERAIEQVRTEVGLHPKDVYYTVKQVAAILSVDRTTLHRWGKLGYLMPVKFGGLVRYHKSDVEALIETREV
ncbi:MAG: helix-turn-helix domain-containing protein [Rikenellaceae bacterium]